MKFIFRFCYTNVEKIIKAAAIIFIFFKMGVGCWDGRWRMEDGCRMMDVFFYAKSARLFLIILKLMGAKARRSAKGRNIFEVDELMMGVGCWRIDVG